jgi:hypothetical protein
VMRGRWRTVHTYSVRTVVRVWKHGGMEDPPGGVISYVVNNNSCAGRVAYVHEGVVTCLLSLGFGPMVNGTPCSCSHNLVVDYQVCQQRMGP